MSKMTKRSRRLLISLGVIVGIVIVTSVVLRMVLTRERLTEMVVPVVEKRSGAKIAFDDIGIRFPFGFGVRIDGLRIARELPGGGGFDLAAAKFNIDISLMSLIRRRPEIKSVTLDGASMNITGTGQGMDVEVEDLGARLSMTPQDSVFVLDPSLTAGKITIVTVETGERTELPPISFSGRVEAPASMTWASLADGKLSVADMAALKIEGDVKDLKGKKEFTASVKSSGLDVRRLVELARERGLVEEKEGAPGFEVESGSVAVDLSASGPASDPSSVSASGRLDLERVVLAVEDMPKVTVGGAVDFSDTKISSKGVSIQTESSEVDAAFTMDIDREKKRPRYVSFDVEAKVDMAEAAAMAPAPEKGEHPAVMEGTLKASVKGGGAPATLRNLFPAKGAGSTPQMISGAWNALELSGTIDFASKQLPGEDGPGRLTDMKATASIAGGSVKSVDMTFDMGGRPWKVKGDMLGVMPALAELMLFAQNNDMPSTLGPVLDGLVNSPDMSLAVEGRALDAAAFQAEAERKKEEGRPASDPSSGGGGAPMETAAADPLANPVTLLALKKTFISVRIDSVISKGALLTNIEAKGRISNGVIRANPVTMDYAGGKGSGRLISDLRDPKRIRNDIDIDFTGIEAGRALGGFNSAGGLVSGKFAMKLDGRFISGPGIDVLRTLTATGRATSTSGTVDLSRFMAPIKSAGINLSSIEKFDFHEWTKKFVIDEGRVASEAWSIRSGSGDWDIAGSFGFDGTLDYDAGLVISPAQQKHMKDLDKYRAIVDLFRDDKGNILLRLDIGGTAKQPKVRLDQSGAKKKAEKKLIDSAKDKLKGLFK